MMQRLFRKIAFCNLRNEKKNLSKTEKTQKVEKRQKKDSFSTKNSLIVTIYLDRNMCAVELM